MPADERVITLSIAFTLFLWVLKGMYQIPNRLKNALEEVYDQLTPEEIRRNQRGDDRLYISVKHPSYTSLLDLYRLGMSKENEVGLFRGLGTHDTRSLVLCYFKGRVVRHIYSLYFGIYSCGCSNGCYGIRLGSWYSVFQEERIITSLDYLLFGIVLFIAVGVDGVSGPIVRLLVLYSFKRRELKHL